MTETRVKTDARRTNVDTGATKLLNLFSRVRLWAYTVKMSEQSVERGHNSSPTALRESVITEHAPMVAMIAVYKRSWYGQLVDNGEREY